MCISLQFLKLRNKERLAICGGGYLAPVFLGMCCQQERNKRNWFAVSFPATLPYWSEFSTQEVLNPANLQTVSLMSSCWPQWLRILTSGGMKPISVAGLSTEPRNGARIRASALGRLSSKAGDRGHADPWSSNPRLEPGRYGECQELRHEQQLRYQRRWGRQTWRLGQWLHSRRENRWRMSL